jgi:hypothetical protein
MILLSITLNFFFSIKKEIKKLTMMIANIFIK